MNDLNSVLLEGQVDSDMYPQLMGVSEDKEGKLKYVQFYLLTERTARTPEQVDESVRMLIRVYGHLGEVMNRSLTRAHRIRVVGRLLSIIGDNSHNYVHAEHVELRSVRVEMELATGGEG